MSIAAERDRWLKEARQHLEDEGEYPIDLWHERLVLWASDHAPARTYERIRQQIVGFAHDTDLWYVHQQRVKALRSIVDLLNAWADRDAPEVPDPERSDGEAWRPGRLVTWVAASAAAISATAATLKLLL